MNQVHMLKKSGRKNKQGFSLIELMVAMFIFVILMGAMVAVSIAGFRSYGKSKAIKTVTEDVGFAINSITKDVRMGKVESAYANGSLNPYLLITRNRDQVKVCYHITSTSLDIQEGAVNCSSGSYKKIVDLTGTNMTFASNSGFYSMATDTTSATKIRGWAEINLNIESPGMDTDSIRVQTIVSSRDYGWETAP